MKAKADKKVYTISEAAKALNLSRVAIFKKIKSGNLPAEKVGNNYVIKADVLEEFLEYRLAPKQKKDIDKALDKTIKDYGDTLKMLKDT